ncbi:MAG: 4Fe-4S dicluster domain-containing protein [Thermincola sp.]|nr:4Fe-4S dicluster domain-containing protein [Thermincola sp.]MDT3701885.1 4Fe-4S dicluster domain-containing protein [Thermincola sp.]
MSRKGFLVNSERCIGCHSCEMACKNEYQQDPPVRWRKVNLLDETQFTMPERNFISLGCNHCEQPECMRVCPVMAYSKRDDGIVVHDQNRCIGCRMCVMACPYGTPQYNTRLKKVEKCHMCYEKQDKGEQPACVAGCPMDALSVIDLDDFPDHKAVKTLPGFPNPSMTKPTTRFIKPTIGFQVRRDR